LKGTKLLLVFLIACAVLSGCGSDTMMKPGDIQKFIMKLKSYQCDVIYAVTNNKSTNVYRAKHFYKAPDKYRIEIVEPGELKGQTTIYNKDKAYIYHPQINTYLTTENFMNSMERSSFVGAFVEHFKDIGGARFKLERLNNVQCYVLQVPLDTDNRYRVVEKIWINAESALPVKAEILDKDNNVNAQILYENFKLNSKLEDSLFEIPDRK
jgi:outer membrane lipoprotein-sorting protein